MSRRMSSSLGSYRMRGIIELLGLYRSSRSNNTGRANDIANDSSVVVAPRPRMARNDVGFPMMQSAGLRFLHAAATGGMGKDGKPAPLSTPPSPSPSPPPRPRRGISSWAKLVLGSVFSMLLAFWTPKWATLLRIGGEAEVVINEVEKVAEVVEKVATVVEKVSEEVAHSLPDDNKIKEAVLVIEHVSKEAAKDAHIAEQLVHKVDAVKQEMEDVEEIVEPIIHKIVHEDKLKEAENS